ncbi:MAG: hypothetical protein RL701_3600 [Pseudomonadota bacterium]|jgi:rubredoxin
MSEPTRGFEGSFLGDNTRLPENAKLECKICWWLYDPALGDPEHEVAPGTQFANLPSHWCCPQCDAVREQFLVLR